MVGTFLQAAFGLYPTLVKIQFVLSANGHTCPASLTYTSHSVCDIGRGSGSELRSLVNTFNR